MTTDETLSKIEEMERMIDCAGDPKAETEWWIRRMIDRLDEEFSGGQMLAVARGMVRAAALTVATYAPRDMPMTSGAILSCLIGVRENIMSMVVEGLRGTVEAEDKA